MNLIRYILLSCLVGGLPLLSSAQFVELCNESGLHYYAVDTIENNGAGTTNANYTWSVDAPGAVVTLNQGPSGSSNGITVDWSTVNPGVYQITVFETDLISGCVGELIVLPVQVSAPDDVE
ncbi:MAG: hypothetical protein ACKO6L_06590, partial [Flavobacteriales bacterium]